MTNDIDALVIGTGLAGLTAALSLATSKKILLVSKDNLNASASSLAQGGISAVFQEPDSLEKHYEDTVVAGAYLNDEPATRFIVSKGRQAVDWLIAQGVPFTRHDDDFHLTREGGHSERRILHVNDMTGRSIQDTLVAHVRKHPNITVYEHHTAVKLLSARDNPQACAGAVLLDNDRRMQILVKAKFTLLATGGAGQIFLHSTAPDTSTGDGIALAWQLGCRVSNLEFLQFHPTCMYFPQGEPFLITEAVRGEGGYLRLPSGERFMAAYDDRLELAPRDLVSRAIYSEMKKHNIPAVHLDISHKHRRFIEEHFPNIHRKCLERNIDMTREPIPVASSFSLHLRRGCRRRVWAYGCRSPVLHW